jgi:hypothetical protein
VQADARYTFGILRWGGAGWLCEFLICVFVHDSDRGC